MLMILVKRTKFKILNYYQKWFYENIQLFDIFRIVSYKQMDKKINFPLFKRETFYTLLINLHSDIDKILEDFSKETRYEIRRAERDGIKVKKIFLKLSLLIFITNSQKIKIYIVLQWIKLSLLKKIN